MPTRIYHPTHIRYSNVKCFFCLVHLCACVVWVWVWMNGWMSEWVCNANPVPISICESPDAKFGMCRLRAISIPFFCCSSSINAHSLVVVVLCLCIYIVPWCSHHIHTHTHSLTWIGGTKTEEKVKWRNKWYPKTVMNSIILAIMELIYVDFHISREKQQTYQTNTYPHIYIYTHTPSI